MFSLYRDKSHTVIVDGEQYVYDCNFNVVLANIDISQDKSISDFFKIRTILKNYLDITNEQLNEWDYEKQVKLYIAISQDIFSPKNEIVESNQKTEDKSSYSFSEDADFIFASFMKDYNINLIEKRNKMSWEEFKALFVSLSKDTKISEVMSIRNWNPQKGDSEEYITEMKELQKVYALKTTQLELEELEIERKKMALMSPEERVAYAKRKLEEGG